MARIVLVVGGRENLRLLQNWLAMTHSAIEHVPGEPLDEACDLCIVDGPGLERFKDEIAARRDQEQPGIFPVLLLTTARDVWARSPEIWHYVDDAVGKPVSKLELQARIEILLRARRLSLDLTMRNEDLEAFIQAMSHDLRASIRAVTMFADALGSGGAQLDEEGKRNLQRIHWSAAEMRDLIESLLNFSRLGRGEIRYRSVDLRAYIQTCLENLRMEIQDRQANVRVKGRTGTVHVDPTLLKIALTNLISNAIKFVPQGVQPDIVVSASIRKDLCRIQIEDNGIGISSEDQQRIFTPFVRLHSEEEFPGVGLGLPSVRKALELMGGRVGVQSTPGRGSRFWIEFPGPG